MKFSNLDVIVLTYNRANYLRVMLDSLCTQTATDFNIKVLNNASTDNTCEVVESFISKYPERNIRLITNEKNLGNPGNFKRSQEIASNEYVAIFHDDDAVHPEYIETAMRLFERHKDAVMVCCSSDVKYNVENINWDLLRKDYFYYPINSVYLQLLVSRPNFATDIYRTDVYKKAHYRPDLYGKLHDICFILDVAQMGAIINLCGYGLRYRTHAGSDSLNFKTGPFKNQIVNVCAYFKNLMNHNKLWVPLVWDFMHFLYKWSRVDEYMEWNKFICSLEINEELCNSDSLSNDVSRELFTPFQKKVMQNKFLKRKIKKIVRRIANKEAKVHYHKSPF